MDFTKPHIYRRQIVTTGKYYIGKHKGGDKYYYGSGTEYKKDLYQYKDIITEIIEYVEDISKLNEREIYWLKFYDAANNPLYYNKTNKSYGPVKQTENWKKHQSKIKKGKSNLKGRKKRKEGTGGKISKANKGRKSGFYGKKHSPKTIEKLKNHPTRNKNISKALKGRDISKWKDKINTKERNNKISKILGEGILQFDLDGNFVKEWISYGEAQKSGFISIQGAIKRNKPYKGYIWKRKKDILN